MSQATPQSPAAGLSGVAFRNQISAIIAALYSANSGAAAPSPTVAGMFWLDTGVSPAVMRVRNTANTAWIAASPEAIAANSLWGNSTGGAAASGTVSMAQLKTMMGYAQSLALGGYQQFASGLIVQFGVTGSIAAGGGNLVTFGLTFPTAVINTFASPRSSANNTNAYTVGTRGETTSTMVVTNNSGTSGSVTASWLAIGY